MPTTDQSAVGVTGMSNTPSLIAFAAPPDVVTTAEKVPCAWSVAVPAWVMVIVQSSTVSVAP